MGENDIEYGQVADWANGCRADVPKDSRRIYRDDPGRGSAGGDFGGARFLREQADAARDDGDVQYGATVVLPCGRAASCPDCLDLVYAAQDHVQHIS